MVEPYLSLISGFVGALVGACASLMAMRIQAKSQERQARARLALDAAVEESRIAHEQARNQRGETHVYPLALYLFHHRELLKLVERDALTSTSLEDLFRRQTELKRVIDRVSGVAR